MAVMAREIARVSPARTCAAHWVMFSATDGVLVCLLVIIYGGIGYAGFRCLQRDRLSWKGQYVANPGPVGIPSGVIVIKLPVHFDVNLPFSKSIIERRVPSYLNWAADGSPQQG